MEINQQHAEAKHLYEIYKYNKKKQNLSIDWTENGDAHQIRKQFGSDGRCWERWMVK